MDVGEAADTHVREVSTMTREQAKKRAALLGMSVWQTEAIQVGPDSAAVDLMCVGFASLGLALAEGETWEEAFDQITRIVFDP
jgi:hypothetical protein